MDQLVIGKRHFALGLRWQEGDPDRKPLAQIKDAFGGGKGLYCVSEAADGRTSIGFIERGSHKPRGRLYSLAQACAAQGRDGIYALPAKGGIWYVAVAGGQVVPETDVCIGFDVGLTALEGMQLSFDFPIYYGGDEPLPLPRCETFNPVTLAEAKIKPLRSVGGAGGAGPAILFAGLVAGGGYLAWDTFMPSQPSAEAQTAEQIAQQRDAYLTGMRSQLAELAASADWANDALAGARGTFPAYVSGWRIEGFACNPKQCVATYRGLPTRQFAPVAASFGPQFVTLTDNGHAMTITLPLQNKMQEWTDEQILAPAAWPSSLIDVLGRVHGAFAVKVDGEATSTDIAAALTPPPDASPVMKDLVAFKVDGRLSRTQLATLVHALGREGFVATTIAVAEGAKSGGNSWRVEFTRIGGK